MSKIQDALSKIQDSRGKKTVSMEKSDHSDDSVVIAKLIDGGVDNEAYPANNVRLQVDHDALRNAGLIAPKYHEQMLADQYRDIKRPLIAHAFGKRATKVVDGNLIMVCSAMSGEGKTFTSINLALSMANERDKSVLLVDADVAKPHTSEMFGAANEPGLLDCLDDPEIPIRSLILPTNLKNFSVLPAGKPRQNATELLSSSTMDNVCNTIGQLNEGQLVIFDSPPLLLTSEAKVLAGHAGQVVVVVRAEETSQEAVTGALSMLDEGKAVNMVLNQARKGFDNYSYRYGYGKTNSATNNESMHGKEIADE